MVAGLDRDIGRAFSHLVVKKLKPELLDFYRHSFDRLTQRARSSQSSKYQSQPLDLHLLVRSQELKALNAEGKGSLRSMQLNADTGQSHANDSR